MKPLREPRQLGLPIPFTWGGARPGAGRKPGPRPATPHRARPFHNHGHPVHATLRARREVGSLRTDATFLAVRGALAAASRGDFRVVHFSVQRDHVHLLVEAKDRQALSRGMRGLAIRVALALNRVLARKGRVWADRWHARALTSPRQVRAALVYVLMNFRKHGAEYPSIADRCSSARWLDGWKDWRPPRVGPFGRRDDERPTAVPRTWLLGHGWRRHGLLSVTERPGPG
jgi:REP element-mobilizing transposase RayT